MPANFRSLSWATLGYRQRKDQLPNAIAVSANRASFLMVLSQPRGDSMGRNYVRDALGLAVAGRERLDKVDPGMEEQ